MPTTRAASTFHLFPLLAPELRLKIWQAACQTRTLTLLYNPTTSSFLTTTPPPTLLRVSHESRSEALLTYTLSFGTPSSQARIYFNPYLDTLYLPRHRPMGYDETLRDFMTFVPDSERALLRETRRVAIDHVDIEIKRPWEAYNKASFLRSFPRLEEVVLVLGNGDEKVGLGKDECFVDVEGEPEGILRLWAAFRESYMREEKEVEEGCRAAGREYVRWTLPTARIRGKGKMNTLSSTDSPEVLHERMSDLALE